MQRPFLVLTAIGWSFCLLVGWLSATRADEAADNFIAERLARRVNIDTERNGFWQHLERLSKAIEVPIDRDKDALMLAGFLPAQSSRIHVGEKPAKELLELILLKHNPDDKLTYIIAVDDEKRTPSGMRIVITTREAIRKKSLIVPPD